VFGRRRDPLNQQTKWIFIPWSTRCSKKIITVKPQYQLVVQEIKQQKKLVKKQKEN
jgi:hypothetical protein